MRLRSTFLAAAIGLTAVLIPGLAKAEDVCGYSYMILPNGNCLRLNYLSILSGSRANTVAANREYRKLFNANVTLEMSDTYRLTETKEERDARYRDLAKTKIARDDVASKAQTVEDILYPVHLKAMNAVDASFAPNR